MANMNALLSLLLASALPAASPASIPTQPNVLWVVVDDLGWHDVGFRSHEILTPNVDALREGGLELTQYYVQSVCSPSRAAFLTGRYPLHNTVNDWIQVKKASALPLNETLLPEVLKQSGYATHAVGKWHLGFYKWKHTPTFRGFDSFYGFYSGGEDYFEHTSAGGYDMHHDAGPNCGNGCSRVAVEAQGRYSTKVFSEQAVKVIENHNASRPLFLYLAYQAVHSPAQVPASYRDRYNATIPDMKRRTFAGMLSCMDEGLGNVTAALKSRGLSDDLLVIFTTDNGGPIFTGDAIGASNYPLKGGKHSIWEGGTRGTAVFWSSKRKPPAPSATYSNLMHAADWVPTLIEATNSTEVAKALDLDLDGVSHWPYFYKTPGQETAPLPRGELVYGRHDDYPEAWKPYDDAIRQGDWKLIQGFGGYPYMYSNATSKLPGGRSSENQTVQLFNVVDDPIEKDECSAAHQDVVQRLSARLDQYRATAIDFPGGGGSPDPSCPEFQIQVLA